MTNDVMSNGATEQLKKFVFTSKCNARGETQEEKLEIIIPEVPNSVVLPNTLLSWIRVHV